MSKPKSYLSLIKFGHPNEQYINILKSRYYAMILILIDFFEMISYVFYDEEDIKSHTEDQY